MITCVSERSGIASSGMFLTAHVAPTRATTVRISTRNLLAALKAMTRLITRSSSAWVLRVARRLLERGQSRAEARLGIDEEVGGGHDLFAGGDPAHDLIIAFGRASQRHRARLEPAAALHDEDDLRLTRVENGLARHGDLLAERHVDRNFDERLRTEAPIRRR